MKTIALLTAFLANGCAQASAPAQDNAALAQPAPPASGTEAEQAAIMDRIERDIRLPEGAGPLASYERTYAWQQRGDNVRKVIGVYLLPEGNNRGRGWVAEEALPLILDGGCSMITLSYDLATQRIEHVTCNGEA